MPALPEGVPAPRPADQRVAFPEILAGFAIGAGISWALRIVLWTAVVGDAPPKWPSVVFPLLAPTFALVAAMAWAFATRRRGWALGMTIYLALGILVLGPVFFLGSLFTALCAPR